MTDVLTITTEELKRIVAEATSSAVAIAVKEIVETAAIKSVYLSSNHLENVFLKHTDQVVALIAMINSFTTSNGQILRRDAKRIFGDKNVEQWEKNGIIKQIVKPNGVYFDIAKLLQANGISFKYTPPIQDNTTSNATPTY